MLETSVRADVYETSLRRSTSQNNRCIVATRCSAGANLTPRCAIRANQSGPHGGGGTDL